MVKKAQYKIMQMAFMIVAVFIFFLMVGIFFFNFQIQNVKESAQIANEQKTIGLISSIANSPEFHCSSSSSLCVDFDKIKILGQEKYYSLYENFWPVSSIEIRIIDSTFNEIVSCKNKNLDNCNYYEVYQENKTDIIKYSSYITLCEKEKINIDKCKLAQLIIGI
ncbi:MAG: hypothetical protein PHX15_00530 [Candidatus Nanoarchaeia archaeon]|jgi:hypothetical protein|nr:hypothetical protein [Candidatus Nanoarchaeia archaeon]MDD3993670.1 hypothetical protein [Candidatus Nanoarchaeia archaeon]MDD4563753.1 hypothetical protein [Candidatus Nanoarchaeia archaeon]